VWRFKEGPIFFGSTCKARCCHHNDVMAPNRFTLLALMNLMSQSVLWYRMVCWFMTCNCRFFHVISIGSMKKFLPRTCLHYDKSGRRIVRFDKQHVRISTPRVFFYSREDPDGATQMLVYWKRSAGMALVCYKGLDPHCRIQHRNQFEFYTHCT
jgi:hypothetical protein